MTAEAMQSLIGEFGGSIGIPDLRLDEENRCNLMFDDVAVSFELSHSGESLYIYSYLGDAPNENPEKVYARLLDANYIFKHTRGATLGMEESSKKIVLIREYNLRIMRLTDFEAVVETFVDLAEYWKRRIAGLASEEERNSLPDSDETVGTYAVKV